MNFKIYLPQKKLKSYYKSAIAEYDKRLSRYCKIKLIQSKDNTQITKYLNEKSYLIQIDPKGKSYTSEEFANKIQNLANASISDIEIIIGEVEDYPIEILPKEVIALSPLSLNLELETTLLYEQIYRAYRILNNQPYHK